MWNLDAWTLLLLEAFVLFLVGGLMLYAALLGWRNSTLLWMAVALLLGGLGFITGALPKQGPWGFAVICLANILLILAHACMWASVRLFVGKPVSRYFLLAGALAWLLLCQWPWFMASLDARITVFSLFCVIYIVAAAWELWPVRKEDPSSIWLLLFVLIEHGLFYTYRALPRWGESKYWLELPSAALVMLEGILFSVSLAIGTLVLVRGRSERHLRYAAQHDELTGLANRRALFTQGMELAQKLCASKQPMALLMCDLDYFKRINDLHGHITGDKTLILFADLLRKQAQKETICARIGGEEFVVLVPYMDEQQALEYAQALCLQVSEASSAATGPLGVSIGIASSNEAGYDLDKMMLLADEALYVVKESGRGKAQVWSPGLQCDLV